MQHLKRLAALAVVFLAAGAAAAQEPEVLSEGVGVYRALDFAATPAGAIQLELFFPRAPAGPVPAIVVIPGGGFRPQSREKSAGSARALAEAGFAAASIGYRGAPDATFRATVSDTKAAVRFLRANAARFNINPDRIGAFGQSAGGHLAVMLAVSGGVAELEGDGGHPEVSSRVQAAVSFAGVFDFVSRLKDGGQQQGASLDTKRKTNGAWVGEPFSEDSANWKLASPFYHVTPDDPPVLFVHCKDDRTVPYQQSIDMYEHLKPMQPESRLLVLEEGGHGIRSSEKVKDQAWAATVDFLRASLAN